MLPEAGVPLRTPVDVLKVTPDGKVPDALNAGEGLPVAVTVNVPAEPTVKVALLVVVIVGATGLAVPKKTPLMTALEPAVLVT